MIPPKRFDIFSPCVGCSEGLDAFRFFFKDEKSIIKQIMEGTDKKNDVRKDS